MQTGDRQRSIISGSLKAPGIPLSLVRESRVMLEVSAIFGSDVAGGGNLGRFIGFEDGPGGAGLAPEIGLGISALHAQIQNSWAEGLGSSPVFHPRVLEVILLQLWSQSKRQGASCGSWRTHVMGYDLGVNSHS